MITAMAAKKCYKLLITALLFLMNATGGWKEYYRAIDNIYRAVKWETTENIK